MIPLLGFLFKSAVIVGTVVAVVDFVKDFFKDQPEVGNNMAQAMEEAKKAGYTDKDIKELVAATTYDNIESRGENPDDFWAGIPDNVKKELEFSPQHIREQMQVTKFGGIASSVLFIGALFAGGVAAWKGIPILLKTVGLLHKARQSGATALELMTIVEEGKIAGLARVWVPGFIGTVLSAGGWSASTITNNLNDAFLWGRNNLRQAEADFNKEKALLAGLTGPDAFAKSLQIPRTRITVSKSSTPKIALGVIFSMAVDKFKTFERKIDDKITDKDDLKADAQANLNMYLASMGGRIKVRIATALNPFDEFGVTLQGNWIVMQIGIQNIVGKFTPLDTIPLGPYEPETYTPTPKEIETIQFDIPKLLSGQEIATLDFPKDDFKIVTKAGEIVPVDFSSAVSKEATPAVTTAVKAELKSPEEDVVAKTQRGELKPYLRFGNNDFIFSRIGGRYIPYNEAVSGGYFANSLVQDVSLDLLDTFSFANVPAGYNAKEVRTRTIAGQPTVVSVQQQIVTPATPAPAPVAPAPAKLLYIRFAGSPNVFNRQTGQLITQNEALRLQLFTGGKIEDIPTPRQEVKVASDFALWNDRNLTYSPV